jgi:hypothetical protein
LHCRQPLVVRARTNRASVPQVYQGTVATNARRWPGPESTCCTASRAGTRCGLATDGCASRCELGCCMHRMPPTPPVCLSTRKLGRLIGGTGNREARSLFELSCAAAMAQNDDEPQGKERKRRLNKAGSQTKPGVTTVHDSHTTCSDNTQAHPRAM